jgi:hypothetical protein
MIQLEISDEEREALTRHLREHLQNTPYPFDPALRPLRAILDKLEPPPAQPEPYPAPKRVGEPRYVLAKRKRRR